MGNTQPSKEVYVDITTISNACTAIKILKESIITILNSKIEAETKTRINEVLEKLSEVQDTLFYLREELSHLQSENTELKERLKEKEDWDNRIKQYSLTKTEGGAFVYISHSEPKHYICPSCITKKEIHIIQDCRSLSGKFICPGCDKQFPINPVKHQNLHSVINPDVSII